MVKEREEDKFMKEVTAVMETIEEMIKEAFGKNVTVLGLSWAKKTA